MTTNTFFLYLAFLSLSFSLSAVQNGAGVETGGMCSYAVAGYGYKCLEYNVTTDDGYILSVQRIPEGRRGNGLPRQPVLLQHGLFIDAKTWFENSPEQSLALLLADNGFDVWTSNFRGTRFSRRHVSLDPKQPEFWNWTWTELAHHDTRSAIDFVVKETGQQIHYVGHSMGTTVAFALLSEGKFGNVKSAALLSPIAHLSHVSSPVAKLGAESFLGELGVEVGVAEFDINGPFGINFLKQICNMIDCRFGLTPISGNDCCLNKTVTESFIANDLQPSSTKNLAHLAQSIRTGVFAQYNYGTPLNILKYGSVTPPIYNLSNIALDFPLLLSYGGRDALSNVTDNDILLGDLKAHNREKLQVEFIPQYAHVDFILGVNANQFLYGHVIDFFRKYN